MLVCVCVCACLVAGRAVPAERLASASVSRRLRTSRQPASLRVQSKYTRLYTVKKLRMSTDILWRVFLALTGRKRSSVYVCIGKSTTELRRPRTGTISRARLHWCVHVK